MKILITGSDAHWALENVYKKHLSEWAEDCRIFKSAGWLEEYLGKSIANKVLFRTGLSTILNKINAELLAEVTRQTPDVLLVFKGIELLPKTLVALKKKGIRLFSYNPDHPFIRTFRSGGGKNVEESVPHYDLHFCYARSLMQEIEQRCRIATKWLPFGFELDEEEYQQLPEHEEILSICFTGNPDKDRAVFIKGLLNAGLPVDVYGHGWNRFLTGGNGLRIFGPVYKKDFWTTLRKYRVQLNLFRPHNEGSHNMRSFEVPAAGGLMLAPNTAEHRHFFQPGSEIFTYDDLPGAIQRSKEMLTFSSATVAEIRKAARHRSVEEDYSYKRRARDVYETMEAFR